MDTLIEELVAAIKNDDRYQNFMEQEKKLQDNEIQALLQRYQVANKQYQEVKQYQSFIDLTEMEETIKTCKQEISASPTIQTYYQSYHAINDVLEAVTKTIFDGISEELDTSRYTL